VTEQDKKQPQLQDEESGGIPFYPLHFMKEVMVVTAVLLVILALSIFFPAGLQEAADSFSTPEHIKPEWVFLAMYQLLKYVPQGVAFGNVTYLNLFVAATGILGLAVAALPFLDRSPHTMARKRPLFLALGLLALALFVVFTYLGHFSGARDPIFGMLIP
jgi:quinol-cytochrome oxidoreductase complex cytochrome b subunit